MKITDLVPWRGSGRDVTARSAPIDPMSGLQTEVERAFDNFWRAISYPFTAIDRTSHLDDVRVDVGDNGKEVKVTAELPGISEADIDVSISNGLLTIRGEKKSEYELEENSVLVKERTYGTVERTITLPDGIIADAATATFRNGVLTLTIPKSTEPQAKARRVSVQAG